MQSRFLLLALAPAMLLPATRADASLFVAGDINILTKAGSNPANAQFLENIRGNGVVILHPGEGMESLTSAITSHLSDVGASWVVFDPSASFGTLGGASSLYVSYLNDSGWTADEAGEMLDFMAGGGNILLSGDWAFFSDANAAINDLTLALGSDLAILNDDLDPDLNSVATILAANPFTAGTAGLGYTLSSRVTGGIPLYGTQGTATPILAVDAVDAVDAVVPEPASWALLIAGFGLVGAAMRRRRRTHPLQASPPVQYRPHCQGHTLMQAFPAAPLLLSALVLGAAPAGATNALISFTGGAVVPAHLRDETIGWMFQANQDLTVTALGWWTGADLSLASDHEIGIWSLGGLEVSTTITAGAATDSAWRFAEISPVSLSAGSIYFIGGRDQLMDGDDFVVMADSALFIEGISFIGAARSTDGAGFAFPGTFSPGTVGRFGPNFQVVGEGAVIPEPASWALLIAGFGAIGRAMRRRAGLSGPSVTLA